MYKNILGTNLGNSSHFFILPHLNTETCCLPLVTLKYLLHLIVVL